jgi:hypothetical protein
LKSCCGYCFFVPPVCILATGSCFYTAATTTVFYDHSFNNFVVLCADDFQTVIALGSGLRDFPGEVSS